MMPLNTALHLTAITASLIVVTGCKQKAQLNADAADSSLVVSLERGPCHGTCPVYRVDVYGDGKVQFDGKQHVAKTGLQTGTVSVASIQDLLGKFRESAFAKADTAYMMDSPGCGQYATDLPTARLSAKIDGTIKTVQHDRGCRNAPEYLRTLEAQVDSVARTAQWIAGNGEAK